MKKILVILIMLSLFSSGCSKNNSSQDQNNQNDIIQVYNPFVNKFILYNTRTLFPVEDKSNEDNSNIMQYSFNTKSKYYTSGDSHKFHFEIVELNEGTIKSVYKAENQENEAIFPLATDGDNIFFLKSDYSHSEAPISTVVKYDNDSLKEYSKAKGVISSNGAILNNLLYYTVYDKSDDSYALYSLDYSRYTNEPKLIKSNLDGRELFVLNNKLYVSNNKTIYNEDGDYFNKSGESFYDIESNTLIQIAYNPNNNNQLSLKIIKADTKKKLVILIMLLGLS